MFRKTICLFFATTRPDIIWVAIENIFWQKLASVLLDLDLALWSSARFFIYSLFEAGGRYGRHSLSKRRFYITNSTTSVFVLVLTLLHFRFPQERSVIKFINKLIKIIFTVQNWYFSNVLFFMLVSLDFWSSSIGC